MFVLGLTGSIAMGKSTAAAMFRRLGVPVFDADQAVHRLLAQGGAAVPRVDRAFPGTLREGAVDRRLLGARVFDDPKALRRLEAILHPLVAQQRRCFLRRATRRRQRLVVLDIPLLFETGGEDACDAVAVVSAPTLIQHARLLRRPGIDRARIAAIARRQMPDAEKRRRADFVIPSGLGRAPTFRTIRGIVRRLTQAPPEQTEKATSRGHLTQSNPTYRNSPCARSFLIRKRPVSTRHRATASSRSAVSNC